MINFHIYDECSWVSSHWQQQNTISMLCQNKPKSLIQYLTQTHPLPYGGFQSIGSDVVQYHNPCNESMCDRNAFDSQGMICRRKRDAFSALHWPRLGCAYIYVRWNATEITRQHFQVKVNAITCVLKKFINQYNFPQLTIHVTRIFSTIHSYRNVCCVDRLAC
jgi:hypothetical protein